VNVGISAVYTARSRVKAELEKEVARLLAEPGSEPSGSEPWYPGSSVAVE
jgi:hypothetical protein